MNIRKMPQPQFPIRFTKRMTTCAGVLRMTAFVKLPVLLFTAALVIAVSTFSFAAPNPTPTPTPNQGSAPVSKKMVTVPAGPYLPFLKREINRPMQVKGFRMDETAVTNAEYLAFVKANPEWRKSRVNPLFADKNYLNHWKSDLEIGPGRYNNPNSPVVNVSWFAARAYAKWAGKRLPTVPEWERAGNGRPNNLGKKSLVAFILEWYGKPNPEVLPPVKSTYQNQFGLWDMHGLIWEWTFDFNSYLNSSDSRGSTQDENQLFCAAGSLGVYNKEDYAGFLRFSYRGSLKGKYCIPNLGFRCIQYL